MTNKNRMLEEVRGQISWRMFSLTNFERGRTKSENDVFSLKIKVKPPREFFQEIWTLFYIENKGNIHFEPPREIYIFQEIWTYIFQEIWISRNIHSGNLNSYSRTLKTVHVALSTSVFKASICYRLKLGKVCGAP